MIRTFIYVFDSTELSLTLLNLELSRIHNFFLNTCYKCVTVLILSILFWTMAAQTHSSTVIQNLHLSQSPVTWYMSQHSINSERPFLRKHEWQGTVDSVTCTCDAWERCIHVHIHSCVKLQTCIRIQQEKADCLEALFLWCWSNRTNTSPQQMPKHQWMHLM